MVERKKERKIEIGRGVRENDRQRKDYHLFRTAVSEMQVFARICSLVEPCHYSGHYHFPTYFLVHDEGVTSLQNKPKVNPQS